MMMLNKQFDFYLLLKEELKNSHMTPRVLCSKMNKPSSWFVNIRKGFTITNPDEFEDLCKVLKIEKSSKLFNEMLSIIKLNYPDADTKDNNESSNSTFTEKDNSRIKLHTFLKELSSRNNLSLSEFSTKIGAPKYTISASKFQAVSLKHILNMIDVFGISGNELTTLKKLYINSLIDRDNKVKAIKAFAKLTAENSQPEEESENFDSAESESKNVDSPKMPIPKNDTDDEDDDDTIQTSYSDSFTSSMVLPKYHDESDYTVGTYRKKFADYLLKYAFLHNVSKEDLKDYFVDYDIDSIIKGTSSLPPYFHLKRIAESLHMNEDEAATFIRYGHKGRGTNVIVLPKKVMAYIGKNDVVAEALYEAAYSDLDENHFRSIIDICRKMNK